MPKKNNNIILMILFKKEKSISLEIQQWKLLNSLLAWLAGLDKVLEALFRKRMWLQELKEMREDNLVKILIARLNTMMEICR